MDEGQLKKWLMENGGPAIRYRTATELLTGDPDADLYALKINLINNPMTQLWLSRIGQPGELFSFHGSKPAAFENACIKLSELGIKAGTPAFDEKTASFRHDFSERSYTGKFIVAGTLTRAGYGEEPAIYDFLLNRLEILYTMARTKNFDIYVNQDTFSDFPSAFRKRPLLNPAYNSMLPSIYDMLVLAYWPPSLKNAEIQNKINTIVDYVLHPAYQAFDEGYGVMRASPRRYYSIGWSVHLPGYEGFNTMSDRRDMYFVQRVEMMARFPHSHNHRWLKQSLAHLEGFQQTDGTYRFPGRYLRELTQGYWVTGAYTRLEENRRPRMSLTIESTFRILRLQSYMKT